MENKIQEGIDKATKELKELAGRLGVQVDYVISDWKDHQGHITEIVRLLNAHPGWQIYPFPAWHQFKDGSGDDQVAVLTSGPIPESEAEEIANLVYNLGAEIE